jgi:hypothetical protein
MRRTATVKNAMNSKESIDGTVTVRRVSRGAISHGALTQGSATGTVIDTLSRYSRTCAHQRGRLWLSAKLR